MNGPDDERHEVLPATATEALIAVVRAIDRLTDTIERAADSRAAAARAYREWGPP